jgi:hypothetical protein
MSSMPSFPTILYVTEGGGANSKLLHALLASGYRVISLRSPEERLSLAEVTILRAVLIDGKFNARIAVLAKHIKFLAPELPVVLVSPEPESNAPPPPNVDAVAYFESPKAFVHALTALLESTLLQEQAVPA